MNNLDENGFAIKDTRVKVYNYSRENNELTSSTYEHVVEGSGIPALSTLIEPNEDKKGFTQVFNEAQQSWEYVEDHREEKYYSTEDGSEVEIKELGVLPENVTKVPCPTQWHNFLNGEWVLDQSAKDEAEKQAKIDALDAEMTRLRNDIIFGQAMGDDVSKEIARVKEIREELIEIKAKKLPDIDEDAELEQGGLSG